MEGKLLASAPTEERLRELIRRYYGGAESVTWSNRENVSAVVVNGRETGTTFVRVRGGRFQFFRWSA